MFNKIGLENFKGNNTDYNLEKVNLFTGEFGSGKSSVIQGMKFLLSGTITDGGITRKKNEELFKLSSANSFNVFARYSGTEYTRGILNTGEGFKTTADVDKRFGEKTTSQVVNRIESDLAMDQNVLNLSDFTKLSADKKKQYIFSIYPQPLEWTEEKINKYLSEETELEENEIVQLVSKLCFEKGVNEAIEFVNTTFNKLKKQNDENNVALKNLAEIRQEMTESAKGLPVLKVNQEKLQNELAEIQRNLTESINKNDAVNKCVNDILLREDKINQINDTINFIDVEKFEKELKELNNQICENSKNIDLKKVELQSLEINFEHSSKSFKNLRTSYEEIEDLAIKQREKFAIDQKNVLKNEEIINKLQNTISALECFDGTCPVSNCVKCKTDMTPALESIKEELFRNESLKEELVKIEETSKKLLEELETKLENLLKSICSAENLNIKFNSEIDEINKSVSELELKNDNTRIEIKHKTSLLEKDKTNISKLKSDIYKLKEEIKTLESKIHEQIDVSIIKTEFEATKYRLQEINDQIVEKTRAKTNLENLSKQEEKAQKEKEELNVYKVLKNSIGTKGLAGLMFMDSIKPLVSGVQENLINFVNAEFYIDENFNFGWEQNGIKRSFETLSGGETLILTTAIVLELMQHTCRVKLLLIDDLNHIDTNNVITFLQGLCKLKDKFDNAVMAANFVDETLISNIKAIDSINLIQL